MKVLISYSNIFELYVLDKSELIVSSREWKLGYGNESISQSSLLVLNHIGKKKDTSQADERVSTLYLTK